MALFIYLFIYSFIHLIETDGNPKVARPKRIEGLSPGNKGHPGLQGNAAREAGLLEVGIPALQTWASSFPSSRLPLFASSPHGKRVE